MISRWFLKGNWRDPSGLNYNPASNEKETDRLANSLSFSFDPENPLNIYHYE
jgi:hypothetical protein